jgi:hypothetical protein
MSKWLQSIGNALEKLDDGASQGVEALRSTLAATPLRRSSSSRNYDEDEEDEDYEEEEEEEEEDDYEEDDYVSEEEEDNEEEEEEESYSDDPIEADAQVAAASSTTALASSAAAAPPPSSSSSSSGSSPKIVVTAFAPLSTSSSSLSIADVVGRKDDESVPTTSTAQKQQASSSQPRNTHALPTSISNPQSEIQRLQQTIAQLKARHGKELVEQSNRLQQKHAQQLAKQTTLQQQIIQDLQHQLKQTQDELQAQQDELLQAAQDIQDERDSLKEERLEFLQDQHDDRQEWQTQHEETLRKQTMQYLQQIQDLQATIQQLQVDAQESKNTANQTLQATLAREQALLKKLEQVEALQNTGTRDLENSQNSIQQLQERVAEQLRLRQQSEERERALESKLDQILEQHQHQASQRQARETELEQTIHQLGAALTRQQQQQQQTAESTSGGEETSESSNWKDKYERVKEEMDTMQTQFQLSEQRSKALEKELLDVHQERSMELTQTQERQQQQDAVVTELTARLNRTEVALREHKASTSTAATSAGGGGAQTTDGTLQRVMREAEHAKQQVSSLSDQLIRQQGLYESTRSEVLALKGRLQAATARADAAELQLVSELEHGNEGPYGPTPSKLRRRVKGGNRYGRGYVGRTMRAALGWRIAHPGSWQEQVARTVDAFDSWLLDTGDVLKSEPLARVAFVGYLTLLHIWCLALVSFHAIQSEHADLGSLKHRSASLAKVAGGMP